MPPPSPFKPALIVVDMQEDFCPPNGSLAVPEGRDIIPLLNTLLTLPFHLKIATKDFHPPNHISFASNHPPPNNIPFASTITIGNPSNPSETETTRLWPVHCVQGTPGASLVPSLALDKLDRIVEKGQDPLVEMYSAFSAPFSDPRLSSCDSGLAEILRKEGVSHVYVCGLAFDYCVKFTALDAAREGFETVVVGEATRVVDKEGWEGVVEELKGNGVRVVAADGEEVGWVKGSDG
ncbi:Isochorismatase hydrolase [Aulographum hederae CBS 113979]|uniref:nicotinamidase n=1 Tax=Aulographum hederae CBS 113979 TaxID=1176131 RepID=A0A6G1HBK4_9PEZI|nr:Isochorismatase hydrolase [Aulographum hederae CBS 113979]